MVLNDDFSNLPALLNRLGDMEIQRLMVEGGPFTIRNFLEANLVDEFYLVRSQIEHQAPYSSGIDSSTLSGSGLQFEQTLTWGSETVELFRK